MLCGVATLKTNSEMLESRDWKLRRWKFEWKTKIPKPNHEEEIGLLVTKKQICDGDGYPHGHHSICKQTSPKTMSHLTSYACIPFQLVCISHTTSYARPPPPKRVMWYAFCCAQYHTDADARRFITSQYRRKRRRRVMTHNNPYAELYALITLGYKQEEWWPVYLTFWPEILVRYWASHVKRAKLRHFEWAERGGGAFEGKPWVDKENRCWWCLLQRETKKRGVISRTNPKTVEDITIPDKGRRGWRWCVVLWYVIQN